MVGLLPVTLVFILIVSYIVINLRESIKYLNLNLTFIRSAKKKSSSSRSDKDASVSRKLIKKTLNNDIFGSGGKKPKIEPVDSEEDFDDSSAVNSRSEFPSAPRELYQGTDFFFFQLYCFSKG